MPCYRPIDVRIKRKLPEWSLRKYDSSDEQTVPCGNCVGCRAEQGRQWAVRMMHEARMHESNLFVTLTLDDEHLNENRELDGKALSGFVRDLRKRQERKLSFFGCGEYGERNNRPHYHAILFGVDFEDKYPDSDSDGRSFWRSEALDNVWGRGLTEIGTVTMGSASYVAGYVRKKVKQKDYARANPLNGELLKPEFARMSLRPAVGKRWIEKWWDDVYPRDFVVIDGVEAKPPRYYDKWMDKNQPDLMEQVRLKRLDEAIEKTKYQLEAGEAIAKSRINLFAGRDRV